MNLMCSLHLSEIESRDAGLESDISLTVLTLPSSCRSGWVSDV